MTTSADPHHHAAQIIDRTHLLLIEDDRDVRRVLTDELELEGFRVQTAETGEAGLTCAAQHAPDLILLDLGLPDLTGAEVTERLRTVTDAPIIVLTATDALQERVRQLSLGANDFVMKPYEPRELLARVHAHLRRHGAPTPVKVGDFCLYRDQHRLTYAGQDLHLSPTELAIASVLLEAPGQLHAREQLEQRIWPDHTCRNALNVHVSHLRSKLAAVNAADLLVSVRRGGLGLLSRHERHD
ncbi:response regulator transcription factor [Deinococcus radiotolerans]|uniref:DNA-binding response regulator n=1 Tax=Deinococcus radiotolerans TaxID=1309407 RepID=A0ABQ2FL79_9DEIO|nr:response regulator transcription factor [Deinococcus radiotolerans]GGK99668.1 DNA-binding response regulator [Deinococcus radiotolerans]